VQTHGAGLPEAEPSGFVGQGPFWTCTPDSYQHRAKGGGGILLTEDPHAKGAGVAQAAAFVAGDEMTADAADKPCTGDLSSQIQCVIGQCVDLLVAAIDVPADAAPPEDELTTVLLETKEQRLKWRDFLSEAVSKHRTDMIFTSYDVEAEPPKYAKPPLSRVPLAPSAGVPIGHTRESDAEGHSTIALPHVVAPRGAGWSPIVRREPSTGSSVPGPCHGGRGPKFPKQVPLGPTRASGDCEATTPPCTFSWTSAPSSPSRRDPSWDGSGPAESHGAPEAEEDDTPRMVPEDEPAYQLPGFVWQSAAPHSPASLAHGREDKRDPPPAG